MKIQSENSDKLKYLAPEILSNSNDITQKVDIFSLGIILYECLVGYCPFNKYLNLTKEMLLKLI